MSDELRTNFHNIDTQRKTGTMNRKHHVFAKVSLPFSILLLNKEDVKHMLKVII